MNILRCSTAVFLSALLASVSFGIVGCEQDGPVEDAVEEVGDAIDDAGDEIEDAADEVTDKK